MFWHNTPMNRVICLGFVAIVLLLAPRVVLAACTLAAGGLNFGSYDVFSTSHTDSAGAIDVSCDVATPYTLTLSPGSGSYNQRAMVNGIHLLNYNLYSDAAHSLVWGDGSGGTVTVVGNTDTSAQHTVYGRIPAQQNVHVGSYSDLIVVTVVY